MRAAVEAIGPRRRDLAMVGVLAAAIAMGLAGCASQRQAPRQSAASVEERNVRAVVGAYFRAVDARDGKRMCASFARGLQRHITGLQQAPCPEAMRAEARNLPESLSGYHIREVRIEARTAIVSLGGGAAGAGRMLLERAGPSWRISSRPGWGWGHERLQATVSCPASSAAKARVRGPRGVGIARDADHLVTFAR